MRLWKERHQQFVYRLEEFEGDEMWDYEGWDYASEEVDELEEISWQKPMVKIEDKKKFDAKLEETEKEKK